MRSLSLGWVSGNDLEGLAEGLVLATSLLVPLRSCGSVSSVRFDACCRRCG